MVIGPVIHVVGDGALGNGKISAYDLSLRAWVEANHDVIVAYWDGEIEYTEDAIAALKPIVT